VRPPVAPPLLPPLLLLVATLPPEPLAPATTLLLESLLPPLRFPLVVEAPPLEPTEAEAPPLLPPPCPPVPFSVPVSEEHAIPIARTHTANDPDQVRAARWVRSVGSLGGVLMDGLEADGYSGLSSLP
jgi:hypothetical protein